MTQPLLTPHGNVLEDERVEIDQPYNVIVWDDPITLMVTVTLILKKVFGYNTEKAHRLMVLVHTTGKALVWSGGHGEASSYCAQLQASGLQASIEKVDS
jgi:ATP-dependent Clp protease adaptor protein ClpS